MKIRNKTNGAPINYSLEGKVALVTGGGTGLGRDFSLILAGAGASVAVTGRRKEPLEDCVETIEKKGGSALAVICDVKDRTQVEKTVQRIIEWKGRVDILVNNAGIYPPAPFLEITEEIWMDTIDTNLNGAFRFSQVCGRIMVQQKWGRIINIISPSAYLGFWSVAAYGASKGGLLALTKAMAVELTPMGVTVNAICPGVVATEKFISYFGESTPFLLSKGLPLGRPTSSEDLVGVLLLLASEAGNGITGATIPVDGGMTTAFFNPSTLLASSS
ncbi:MAG: SDR family oxidoreductase [Candidatus Anstonellales archaeon]